MFSATRSWTDKVPSFTSGTLMCWLKKYARDFYSDTKTLYCDTVSVLIFWLWHYAIGLQDINLSNRRIPGVLSDVTFLLLFVCLGPLLVVLKGCSWLCGQESYLVVLRECYGMSGIKRGSVACKTNALSAELTQSAVCYIL